jgi:glycopeptide antibiotics resistance protein
LLFWVLFVSLGQTDRNSYFKNRELHLVPFENTYKGFTNLNDNEYKLTNKQIPYYWYLLIRNIAGNILLFIPLGLFIPFFFQKISSVGKVLIFSFFLSFFIESVQYLFALGIFDVDDIIFNIIGAILGFHLFRFTRNHFN